MRKLFTSFLLVSLLGAGGNSAAQYASLPDEAVYRDDARRYGHLEYFGFYASAMAHWNFTGELAAFTNLTWIHVGSRDDEVAAIDEMVERLRQAHEAGVQAVLSLEPFLFLNLRGDLRPDPDTESFLVELRARLELEGLLGTLAMIYPKDEPFREFIRYRDPGYVDQYVTGQVYEDIHEALVHVNDLVKLVFPDKPIGVILSGYSLHHRFFSIPGNYDWVGFDCYDNLFGGCDDDRSFAEHYTRLLDFMQPHQRLMAVPEAWAETARLNEDGWPDVLLSRFRHHYEMALNDPRFIAFIPFAWSLDAEGEVLGIGLDRIPEQFDDGVTNRGTALVEYVEQVGSQIKHGRHQFPNMAWEETENAAKRPASRVRGGIMSVTSGGLVSAWAIDDALPHKNLSMRILVRDSLGRLLHKSRPERSFVLDPDLRRVRGVTGTSLGLHGFRYQIPGEVLARHGGDVLEVELVTYTDGRRREVGHRTRQAFVSSARLPAPTAGTGGKDERGAPAFGRFEKDSGSHAGPRSSAGDGAG